MRNSMGIGKVRDIEFYFNGNYFVFFFKSFFLMSSNLRKI